MLVILVVMVMMILMILAVIVLAILFLVELIGHFGIYFPANCYQQNATYEMLPTKCYL